MATAISDIAEARRDYMDESGGRYVHVIADGGLGTSGDIVKAIGMGADAVMLVPPFYDPLDFATLKVFLAEVAAATSLPIVYYNVPGATGIRLDADQIAEGWRRSLGRPTDARNRVLVALERNLVTGFVMTCPATDPDCDPVSTGELVDLTVDPHQRGAGHGSRLLQAAADTLVADRFDRAVAWLPAGDDALRTFLSAAGWGPDGASRTLDLLGDGSTTVNQVRLHTALVDPS